MKRFADWRKAIALPILNNRDSQWDLKGLEEVLTKAVSQCVAECLKNNNGRICTTLSGGLDSSFCLAKMREAVGSRVEIHTFTTGGSEKHPDVQFARIVSQRFESIHHELIPSEDEIREAKQELYSMWQDEIDSSGNVAVFLTYMNIANHGFKCTIAHDGIDELLGGYWEHRRHRNEQKKAAVFQGLWERVKGGHLLPLERKAQHLGIQVVLPYLQKNVVEYISKIPLSSRTTFEESKIPLRIIARRYLPRSVIERKKRGFCDALNVE